MAAARRSGSIARAAAWSVALTHARTASHWAIDMTEPCDLDAIEARRLIGQKKLAPTELLDKLHRPHRSGGPCGERHGRARFRSRPRRSASSRCSRCARRRSAAAARPADRHQGSAGNRGSAHHLRQHDLPRPRPRGRRTHRGGGARRRARSSSARPTRRNSAPARTRATPSMAPPAIRSIRRALPPARPADRRSRSRPAWCRSAPAPTPAGRCAIRPRSAASSASARRRDWSPTSGAGLAGATCRSPGRWRAPCRMSACCSPPWSATMRAIRWRPRCMAARSAGRRTSPCRARIDLSRLRVALTPDFGFAPTERHIAEVFAEKTGLFRHVFGARRGYDAGLHRRR